LPNRVIDGDRAEGRRREQERRRTDNDPPHPLSMAIQDVAV
jgi:hypothetical protein